ncbi:hypothetical protein L5515_013693 [Caenorhabditis briggsae]|uniref:Uncharacterized protein n=1 Tax=Caenorhabditis briggsae TaxID=6238 RepID=A0AAE9E9V2_CAEBR|nr:hypothetical protein L5515_013693 [Caenorhabditis briggsae]
MPCSPFMFYHRAQVDEDKFIFPFIKDILKSDYTIPYFRTSADEDGVKKLVDVLFEDFDNIPAKEIRDVEKEGFAVQELKDELAYLSLTTNFPEIMD